MAIGRLQAALAVATNEVTVAAANINFDFTLIKCEAPKEYQALGNILSKKRKENAEFGSSHVLARQLGALFDGVCPSAPSLLEAYGKRASEIANVAKETSEPFVGTLFGEHTGIDGTSIWAAATSSKCALHIHLLACLLARVWSAPEAVAIWVELVSDRKKDIARKVDEGEPVPFALAAAVGQDISKPQLAAMDASARSWLRTADYIFRRKQKQLDLILKNLELSSTVLSGVIDTWKIALETMNKLVSGEPQAVQDGAALLGLSAWHLYPDMSIYSSGPVEVKMEDSCVAKGGILSLGVSRRPSLVNEESGVRWSLSLSHLRHYGRPVKVTRVLEDNARLTWSQFNLVIFAALLERWRLEGTSIEALARLLTSLFQHSKPDACESVRNRRIFELLKDGASAYTNRVIGAQDLNHRLIQLGRRRSHQFFRTKTLPVQAKQPTFGLFNLKDFMLAFKHPESAILYFRHAAKRLSNENTPSDTFLIRDNILRPSDAKYNRQEVASCWSYRPLVMRSEKDPAEPSRVRGDKYVDAFDEYNDAADMESFSFGCQFMPKDRFRDSATKSLNQGTSGLKARDNPQIHRNPILLHEGYAMMTALAPGSDDGADGAYHHRWLPAHVHDYSVPDGETSTVDATKNFKSWTASITKSEEYDYNLVCGIPELTALFARRLPDNMDVFNSEPTVEDVQWCLDHDLLDLEILSSGLDAVFSFGKDDVTRTLRALAAASLVYDEMADATIDTKIVMSPLVETYWAHNCQSVLFRHEDALSMISYLETGTHNIDPKLLKNAIAVSNADSIFVSSALIQDPSESLSLTSFKPFRRILGNIGKPGLTILLPPKEPIMREIDTARWRLDSYLQFDGTMSKSFQETSMHLSATDYYVPLSEGLGGARDNEVFFLESVISVQDKDEWVADVDPIPLIQHHLYYINTSITMPSMIQGRLNRLKDQGPCQHKTNSYMGEDITAVDTWNELLDVPAGIFVVRTGKNWVARLASTLVASQQMTQTSSDFAITVCPPQVCWTCAQSSLGKQLLRLRKQVFIF